MQVVMNKKEKEQLVIKLYQDGNPIRISYGRLNGFSQFSY